MENVASSKEEVREIKGESRECICAMCYMPFINKIFWLENQENHRFYRHVPYAQVPICPECRKNAGNKGMEMVEKLLNDTEERILAFLSEYPKRAGTKDA